MTLTIKINLDDDAFSEDAQAELMHVLTSAVNRWGDVRPEDITDAPRRLWDFNGNDVGTWEVGA